MKRPKIMKEEILVYLIDEWNDSLREHKDGLWLTTRAIQIRLRERGLITTWPTLALRMYALQIEGLVEKIQTSNGECWRPVMDTIKI